MILRKKLGKIFIVPLLNRFVALNYNGLKLVLYIDYFQPKNTYIISKQWTLQTVTFATRKKQYHICYGPALKPFSLIQQLNQWFSTTNTYTNNIEELFIFNIGNNIEEANQHTFVSS